MRRMSEGSDLALLRIRRNTVGQRLLYTDRLSEWRLRDCPNGDCPNGDCVNLCNGPKAFDCMAGPQCCRVGS